jgi:hypothetical protein
MSQRSDSVLDPNPELRIMTRPSPKSCIFVIFGLTDLNPFVPVSLVNILPFVSAEIVKETCSGELEGPQLVRYRHQLSNMYICFSKKGAVKAVVSTYLDIS